MVEDVVAPVVLEEVEEIPQPEPVAEVKPAEPVKSVGLDKNLDFGNLWDAFKRG